jgi:hypothetical protein
MTEDSICNRAVPSGWEKELVNPRAGRQGWLRSASVIVRPEVGSSLANRLQDFPISYSGKVFGFNLSPTAMTRSSTLAGNASIPRV